MHHIKKYILIYCLLGNVANILAQTTTLSTILDSIRKNNPQLKMYDADIQSMNAAAKGAKSWMPPQITTGFFMAPYNTTMWKASDMNPGMGSYMMGITQMIPNQSKLKADYNYMNAMSSVEVENKNFTINQLNAIAKTNYYQCITLQKKLKIANDNKLLLQYMIKSMEIRYQYNMDKLSTYFKAKSELSNLESMIAMLENNIVQKKVMINTLMAREKSVEFDIDTTYQFKNFDLEKIDSTVLTNSRSDIKALDKTIALNKLKIETEKKKLLPEFGVQYDHMFAFGEQPQQFSLMLMVNIPFAPWSSKMNKSNINSYKIKNESLAWQKQMIVNETSGMIKGMATELQTAKKQYDIAINSTIPALKKNYDTSVIAWQNNTGDLFLVLDAWEALNMTQMDAIDKLQSILEIQVEIEKQLETN